MFLRLINSNKKTMCRFDYEMAVSFHLTNIFFKYPKWIQEFEFMVDFDMYLKILLMKWEYFLANVNKINEQKFDIETNTMTTFPMTYITTPNPASPRTNSKLERKKNFEIWWICNDSPFLHNKCFKFLS